jgi:hypothetical protein
MLLPLLDCIAQQTMIAIKQDIPTTTRPDIISSRPLTVLRVSFTPLPNLHKCGNKEMF